MLVRTFCILTDCRDWTFISPEQLVYLRLRHTKRLPRLPRLPCRCLSTSICTRGAPQGSACCSRSCVFQSCVGIASRPQLSASVLFELAKWCTGEAPCMNMENSKCVPWPLEYVASLRLGYSGGHEPGRQLSARNRHGAAIPSGDVNITTLRTEINDEYTRKLVYPVIVLTSHSSPHTTTAT